MLPNIHNLNIRTLADSLPRQVKRHEIEFAAKPNRSDIIEAHCRDFRHGRVWKFDGVAHIDPRVGSPFKFQVELTASNLRGKVTRMFGLQYAVKEVDPDDLIDFETRKYRVKIPLMVEFDHALKSKNMDWLQFLGDEETSGK
jgi:hypothetical protein